MSRPTGYYWVQFNWPRFGRSGPLRWEPASWDAEANAWLLIGSTQTVPADREREVLVKIDETLIPTPTPPIINPKT